MVRPGVLIPLGMVSIVANCLLGVAFDSRWFGVKSCNGCISRTSAGKAQVDMTQVFESINPKP